MYRYTAEADARSGAPPADDAQPAGDDDGFRHDSVTVLSYGALMCFTFWVYGYGPALALLRDELEFSYTLMGVYTAVWSGGTVLTGLSFPLVARRLSRAALMWSSALLASAGAVLFVVGDGVAPTLAGGAVIGLGGTTLLTSIQAVLSDRHAARRDRALTEANIGAAVCAVLAPLTLGVLVATPLGWRAALLIPSIGLGVLYWRFRGTPLPASSSGGRARTRAPHTARAGRLPLACWLFVGLVAASMAVEFCLAYFGAEHLVAAGASTGVAVTAMSSHYVGLLAGRVGGAVVTRRPGRDVPLLHASLALTAAGFLLFWAGGPVVAVSGLFVAGVGIANLYPLALAQALAAARGREDEANGRSQALGGVFVIAAPYLLGSLADQVGIVAAFAVEPVLIGLCFLLLVAGLRARRAQAESP